MAYDTARADTALTTYKETRIKTASQGQLIIMLYDESIRRLNRALELMDLNSKGKKVPGRIEQISKCIMKTEEIITELMVSLDFEQGGDISRNLFALYAWFNRELLEANIAQDRDRLSAVRDMIGDLRETWYEIVNKTVTEIENREILGINIAG
ncbi:MAG: flagellar export chaperone FliS [Treponema sp.]|nr:flagellar export chaperone FliS [Treponema sp.]